MIRVFQRLGDHIAIPLIPSTEILTAEDRMNLPQLPDLAWTSKSAIAKNTRTHGFLNLTQIRSAPGSHQPPHTAVPAESPQLIASDVGTGSYGDRGMCAPSYMVPEPLDPVDYGVGVTPMISFQRRSNTSNQAPTTQNPSINTGGGAYINADFSGGGHAFGKDSTVNNNTLTIGVNKEVNNVTTVNNFGRIHGMEKLEKSVSSTAQFDSRAQDPNCQCHPRTRKTVLTVMRDWIANPDVSKRIFWLCGPAGAGKSAIVQTLARSYGRPKVAASFFFYRSDSTRNDGYLLFPTLAYQLSISIPAIKDQLVKSVNERPDILTADMETQFEELIVRPLQALNAATIPVPALVFIDGVDECTDEKLQRRFLKTICEAVKDGRIPLRFIISCRREAHIEGAINRTKCSIFCFDLAEVNADSDIKTYLADEFARIASEQELGTDRWPGNHIIDVLVYRASGQFAYASLVIKFVGDEDCSAESQLAIILGLRPPGIASPFIHLDGLYLEILRRHPDQTFLASFLSLFVTCIPYNTFPGLDLHNDDPLLLDISEKEFRARLRRLRSLFKFEPCIDVHHRSFLEFLHDSSRSGEYHINEKIAARRYLELITKSLVDYASSVIDNPHLHNKYHFQPLFGMLVHLHPVKVALAVEGWWEVLQPLLLLLDKILDVPNFNRDSNLLSCDECTGFRIIRYLLFNLVFLEKTSLHTALYVTSKTQKTSSSVTFSPPLVAIETGGNTLDKDLHGHLNVLLVHCRKTELQLSTIGDLVLQLLRDNSSEIAKNVCSVSDALTVMCLIDKLITGLHFHSADATRRALQLALEIYAIVPILPPSLFFSAYPEPVTTHPIANLASPPCNPCNIFSDYSSYLRYHAPSNISILERSSTCTILDNDCIVPVVWIYDDPVDIFTRTTPYLGCFSGSIDKTRLQGTNLERLDFILRLALLFKRCHSSGIVLHYEIDLISVLPYHPRISLWAVATSYIEETPHLNAIDKARLTYKANMLTFGRLFYYFYLFFDKPFDDRIFYDINIIKYLPPEQEIHEDAWQLIQQCCAEDPKNRPTMDEVVQGIKALIMELKGAEIETSTDSSVDSD